MQFCKKCGTENDLNNEYCVKCGRKLKREGKKKKKIIPIIVIALLFVIILVIFLRMLSMSQWSLEHMGKTIADGHWKCFIAHDFIEPTCEHGFVCSLCGLEEGNVGEHIWIDATCTTAKTCSICGEIEGEPLGHSTGIGYCSICNEYSKELWTEFCCITDSIIYAADDFENVRNNLYSASTSYYAFEVYIPLVKLSCTDMAADISDAITYCGDHEEFHALKIELEKAYDAFLATGTSSQGNMSNADYGSYLQEEIKEAAGYMEDALLEYEKLEE